MKKTLLLMMLFVALSMNAQTTYNLNWERFANGPEMDITIEIGDIVVWTWTDAFPHTVQNVVGNSVETFNSGTLTGLGETYSHTFTVEGANDYFCGIHGAASMSGTITVVNNLSVDDEVLKSFSILNNPTKNSLNIEFSQNIFSGQAIIQNLLGKIVLTQVIDNAQTLIIDVSALSSGLYLITIKTDNLQRQTKRFIKK